MISLCPNGYLVMKPASRSSGWIGNRSLQYLALMLALFCTGVSFPLTVWAFDWDYSPYRWDLTQGAVVGSERQFHQWAAEPTNYFLTQANVVVGSSNVTLTKTVKRETNAGNLSELVFKFRGVADGGADLDYSVVILTPNKRNTFKLPVVTFDGHGDCGGECSGKAPQRMFTQNGFAYRLAKLGYVVIGFPTAIHGPFVNKSKEVDYPVIWASLARKVLASQKGLDLSSGEYVVAGSAIGGLTALALSIIDSNAKATITNGAFFPLELTRREYRIKNHPFCHDFRAFYTYTSVYALLAPKPLMIQMGKDDGLWLGHGPAPASDWFSGIRRGATIDETMGAAFVLERIYSKFKAPFVFKVHKGGHEDVDTKLIDRFLQERVSNSLSDQVEDTHLNNAYERDRSS